MSVEAITEKILNDTEKQCQAITKETEKSLKNIEKELETGLKDLEDKYHQKMEEIKNKNIEKVTSNAESQVKKMIETEKRDQLDSIFKETFNYLTSLSEKEYSEILVKLLKNLPLLEMKEIKVSVPEERVKESKEAFDKLNIQVSKLETDKNIKAGAIINEENFRYDIRFEYLLDQIQENHETKVARMLFAEQK